MNIKICLNKQTSKNTKIQKTKTEENKRKQKIKSG
jgi:hypothetical protein